MTDELRQSAYRDLFNAHISERCLEDIRSSTNKAWVLGIEYFKEKIEDKLSRAGEPKPRGGDRRSKKFCHGLINRV